MNRPLSLRDALLAIAIMAVWGTNFVVARTALNVLPPLLFAALRFSFVLLPLALVLPRPQIQIASASGRQYVTWRNLAVYGFSTGVGQFGLLFIAMDGMISPGLASLVVQMQVFFTVLLSMLRNRERLKTHQFAAFGLAIAGMMMILVHNGEGATIAGVAVTLGAAVGWAFGNQAAKESGTTDVLAYVVWSSLFAAPPLLLLAGIAEGWPAIRHGFAQASTGT